MKGLLTYRTIQFSMNKQVSETPVKSFLLKAGFTHPVALGGQKNRDADLIISTRLLRAQLIFAANLH